MNRCSSVSNRAGSSTNSAWPACAEHRDLGVRPVAPARFAAWPASRAARRRAPARWNTPPRARTCADRIGAAAPRASGGGSRKPPRSAGPARRPAAAVQEHPAHEVGHRHAGRAAAARARDARLGGGSSPTELSTSTSPASRASPWYVHIGQSVEHAERPADQQHRRRAEPGQQLGDVLSAAGRGRSPRRRPGTALAARIEGDHPIAVSETPPFVPPRSTLAWPAPGRRRSYGRFDRATGRAVPVRYSAAALRRWW